MRLLEFVPCGRPPALPEDSTPSPRRPEEVALASPRLTKEKAELPEPLSPTSCAYPDKRRWRPSHGSASPWRPSLVAISEDGAQAATATVAAKVGARGGGSRKASAKSTGRSLPRKGRVDYW